ncbi:MAG: DNA-directed RNA polymerase subunit beta, partial [Candidatus Methylomirabilis sp.]|nr:DNA-directed RNA polymerase subunit beta [Deltaproteobacteria bacterium]
MAFTKRLRRDFSKIKKVIEIPNLIDVQKKSYDLFLQVDVPHDKRQNIGLQAVFKSVFPIKDFNETAALDFVSYDLGQPKYDVDECRQRGLTFSAPIKVTIRLVIWETNEETKQKSIQSVKEQEVYFGEIPLMTKNATFIINGTERVIVSQLHRSPGVFFDHDKGKSHSSGKVLFNARVIPYRGSWIDFEFDAKDILHVRIDRRRKLPATVLLKALGYDQEQLLNYFYPIETIRPSKDGALEKSVSEATLLGQRTEDDVLHPKTGEVLVKKHREIRQAAIKRIVQAGIKWLPVQQEALTGRVAAKDVVDPRSGEVIAECNEELTEEKVRAILDAGVKTFDLLYLESKGPSLRITLAADKIKTADQAIIEIYRRIRPGDPPTAETARTLFNQLFFDPDRYDLSKVGRLKLNHKLGLSKPLDQAVLDKEDIMECVRYLIDLKTGNGEIDDIDHLGNRRVRSVGELLENQYRVGLVRMERAIKQRMSLQEVDT